jgi:hypothetical protein
VSSVSILIGYTGCTCIGLIGLIALECQNWPWILSTQMPLLCFPWKCRFFISFYVHHPNNYFENISVFLFASLQLISHSLHRKNIGEAFQPPKLCLCLLTKILI